MDLKQTIIDSKLYYEYGKIILMDKYGKREVFENIRSINAGSNWIDVQYMDGSTETLRVSYGTRVNGIIFD